MRSSDDLIREFAAVRAERDRLRYERAGLFCERAEPVTPQDYEDAAAERQSDPLATFVFPLPTQEQPCWKAARQWERDRDGEPTRRFYFSPPPSEWCATCQRRQLVSDAYREIVRRHGGALRGLLRRGRALAVSSGRALN